jgi:AcrR family transcriptional regulator
MPVVIRLSLRSLPCRIEIAIMPLRRPNQAPPHTSDTPQRLREIALELFACKGYQSTSLRDIAAHLGVHAGSIYNHVDNKQTLLFELIEDALDELLQVTRKKLKRATTASANLSLFIRTFINFKKSAHRRLLLVSRESFNLAPEQQQYIAEIRAQYTRCLSDIINSEYPSSCFPRKDAHAVSSTIVAILLNTTLWNNITAEGTIDDILMDILVRSIAGVPTNKL